MSADGGTRIRSAREADAAVIARVHMASRAATMPYLPPQRRNHEQVTRWVLDVLLEECRVWVAVCDAEVVGYAALDGDMLEHLYLRPDVRRMGHRHAPARRGAPATGATGCPSTSSGRTPTPARSTSGTASPSSR